MGHIRLGRIPKTKQWSRVFAVLTADTLHADQLAQAIAEAARDQFAALKGDRGIGYCFWILGQIATASRSEDFFSHLRALGVRKTNFDSGLDFVRGVAEAVSDGLSQGDSANEARHHVFVRMAELSLREVLAHNIVEQSQTLFGTHPDDIRAACRRFSTAKEFGRISKAFFAQFMSRAVRFVVDKELSNYVGPQSPLSTPEAAAGFHRDLDRYCAESARIVQDYAGSWLSKRNWETQQQISTNDAVAFCAYAFEKIQMELSEVRK